MIASRSASSTITNSPFETSQPFTSSSRSTSRSCVGHQRFCLIGVRHSRWSVRKDTSDCRAAGFVASASPTGMLTRPKLMDPFQIVRMERSNCTWSGLFLPIRWTEMRTIWSLWQAGVAENRRNPAYLVEENGAWRGISQAEAATAVEELANGLLARGVKKGDAFGILARTRLEWALFDLALAQIGAVAAGIYPSSTPAECRYILEHSNAVGCLIDRELRDKIEGAPLEHTFESESLAELRAQGREHAADHPDDLERARSLIGDDDLFTFIYTSGTTGPPKACMILNRNYYDMVGRIDEIESFFLPTDVMLLYLPPAHNFGRLMHLLGAHLGFTIAFVPDPRRLGEIMPVVRPTVLPTVPRVLEKVHTAVSANFASATGVKRRLIDWALDVGRQVSELRQRQERVPRGLALRHRIADRLVYSKVKARLGGRLRAAISGGAPLAKEIAEFFHALDILILEGYGQTEETTASK